MPLNDVTTFVDEDSSACTGTIAEEQLILDQTVRHLGRVGTPNSGHDGEPLVMDWRAPAARAFYAATPVGPQGQARRRHIRTQGREVISFDGEPLNGSRASELVGESALLAALDERRTTQMGTAAATLQREQHDVVRADSREPLVVQGGPGTGKTVVALHRVAYLPFTYPKLAAQDVLVIGPSHRFLDYIAQVLPALGESAMVGSTCDTLVLGIGVERLEQRDVAEVKGRALWQPAPAQHSASASSGRSYHAARAAFFQQLHDLLITAITERSEVTLTQADLWGDAPPNSGQGEFLNDRAAAQRDWVYGHIVIDEAQELSEMQWQMLMRRRPSRSITAVGDIDQAEAPRAVADLSARHRGGMVGVIAPPERLPAIRTALPYTPVLSATDAKGLEWDATLLVDAPGIAAQPRGWNGLYGALTRCTQELGQPLVA